VNASKSFSTTLTRALARVNASITSKLDDFFGLSEYDWTPSSRVTAPSMYLYELVNWLTTVVDTLVIKESYKDEAYKSAVEYLADSLMVRVASMVPLETRLTFRAQEFLTGKSIPMLNENGIHNILIDVDFLDEEFKRAGRPQLMAAFGELRAVRFLDTAICLFT
jgi:exocyst complex component 6